MASFNPPTQFQIGDWVEYLASPAISTPKAQRMAGALAQPIPKWPIETPGWHQGMQKDGRFHGGLKGSGQPFYSGSTWKSYK